MSDVSSIFCCINSLPAMNEMVSISITRFFQNKLLLGITLGVCLCGFGTEINNSVLDLKELLEVSKKNFGKPLWNSVALRLDCSLI